MTDYTQNIEVDPVWNARKRGADVIAECRLLATMSEEPERLTRRFLTPPVKDVHAHLSRRMTDLGMTVQVDALGNLRGLWRPDRFVERRLVLGSHIDTVPDAGPFDGVLGVVLALELVASARSMALPYAIEVIAFSEEEGVRFGVPFLGSRAVAGRFDPALLALEDGDGVSLSAAIQNFGLDTGEIEQARLDEEAVAFLEIHIEQGPVLEAEGLQLAAVSAIAGQSRYGVVFHGRANHAGTTPMSLRQDAMAAAAEWIVAVETEAKRHADENQEVSLAATVGKLIVKPNASNVIPATVEVSLDLRSDRDSVREDAVQKLLAMAHSAGRKRGVTVATEVRMSQPAVPMDEELTALLGEAVDAAGHRLQRMPSGAGHDAMVMATRVPSTMLFLRSPGGISHHPDESVRETDVDAALMVGETFLLRLALRLG